MTKTYCLDCEEPIRLAMPLRVGQRITCDNCGTEMEVVETTPLELDWAFDDPIEWEEDGEEWDDEDDDDWDDDEDWDDEDWDDDDDDG
jgi:hypothetical protein